MLEANIWKLKQDLEDLRSKAQVPVKTMQRYEVVEESLRLVGQPMTPEQKQAALAVLTTQMQAVDAARNTARATFLSDTVIEQPTETAP